MLFFWILYQIKPFVPYHKQCLLYRLIELTWSIFLELQHILISFLRNHRIALSMRSSLWSLIQQILDSFTKIQSSTKHIVIVQGWKRLGFLVNTSGNTVSQWCWKSANVGCIRKMQRSWKPNKKERYWEKQHDYN